jgi:Ras-related protein Rab-7A
VTNPESFEKVMEWRDIFLQNCAGVEPYSFPFVLIGNKNDRSEGDKKVLSIKA